MELITKLDAVNRILEMQGILPVDSLDSGDPMAETAIRYVEKTDLLVQSGEWTFNREYDFPLAASSDGTVSAPAALNISFLGRYAGQYIIKGGKVYDRVNHTFRIGHALRANIVWRFDWEDLPVTAQQYISICAARWYQREQLGSETLERYSRQDEDNALLALQASDADLAQYNVLDNPALYDIIAR